MQVFLSCLSLHPLALSHRVLDMCVVDCVGLCPLAHSTDYVTKRLHVCRACTCRWVAYFHHACGRSHGPHRDQVHSRHAHSGTLVPPVGFHFVHARSCCGLTVTGRLHAQLKEGRYYVEDASGNILLDLSRTYRNLVAMSQFVVHVCVFVCVFNAFRCVCECRRQHSFGFVYRE